MATQTGIPLNGVDLRRTTASTTTLLDRYSTTNRSQIFEVRNIPVIISAFGLTGAEEIVVRAVTRDTAGNDIDQVFRFEGAEKKLTVASNAEPLDVSGRYLVEFSGTPGTVLCVYVPQQALVGGDVGMPSGAQANLPNLYFSSPASGAYSSIFEIQDIPWVFNAFGLSGGDTIQAYQVFGYGPTYREQAYRPNSSSVALTSATNAVAFETSGRYRFKYTGASTDVILVGNPITPLTRSEEGGGGTGAVDSVNGQTGIVVLGASDVGAEAAFAKGSLIAGTNVTLDGTVAGRLVGAGDVTINAAGGGGGAVDSVNGQTGVVVLDAADVGAATTAQGVTADNALQPNDGLAALDSAASTKLAGIAVGAEVNVNADWTAVGGDAEILNKPTIPAAQVNADWTAVGGVAEILNKPTLTSGTVTNVGTGTGLTGGPITGTGTVALDAGSIASLALADSALQPNTPITGATKTKVTYDADGLVIGGADATTADIPDSTDARYVNDAELVVIGNTSGTNTGDQIITLTGDVTGTGAGSFAATIANDAVTYGKMQDVSAASKLLGRGSASGSGNVEEIAVGSGLTMTGTTLSASGGGGTPAGSNTELQLNNAGAFGAATGVTWASNQLLVTAQAAGTTPLSVKAATSQTADVFTITTSAGVDQQRFQADGRVLLANSIMGGNAQLCIGSASGNNHINLRGLNSANGYYGIGMDAALDATIMYGYSGRKFALANRAFGGTITTKFIFDDGAGVQTWTHAEAINYVFGTTTGTKLGTATSQKMGFWNATPIIQPAGAGQAAVSGTAGGTYTSTEQNLINDLKTLTNQLRADLVSAGLIKGAA